MRLIATTLLICLLASCGRPECRNENPVFERYGPKSDEYKSELIKQIQSGTHGTIRYWADDYTEINKKPFMKVDVQGDGLCAVTYIDIKNPNKLQHYKNVKGISYHGAEIIGLQYAIDTIEGHIVFLWEEGKIKD